MTKIRKYTQSINNENDTRCPFAANINVSNQPDASQHNLNFTHILTRKPRARARVTPIGPLAQATGTPTETFSQK